MSGGGGQIAQDLMDLVDQVQDLDPVQWGFVLITAASVFAWIWVMGAPPEQRRPAAAGAAVLAGLAVTFLFVIAGAHRPV